jgi:aspartate aminotransferase-like enzyme
VSEGNCFRIGHIGRIFQSDMCDLLAAIRATLGEMGIDLRQRAATCLVVS